MIHRWWGISDLRNTPVTELAIFEIPFPTVVAAFPTVEAAVEAALPMVDAAIVAALQAKSKGVRMKDAFISLSIVLIV